MVTFSKSLYFVPLFSLGMTSSSSVCCNTSIKKGLQIALLLHSAEKGEGRGCKRRRPTCCMNTVPRVLAEGSLADLDLPVHCVRVIIGMTALPSSSVTLMLLGWLMR